jgi:hypothetical protein
MPVKRIDARKVMGHTVVMEVTPKNCIEISGLPLKLLMHIFSAPFRDVVHRSTQLFGRSPAAHRVFTVATYFAIQCKSQELERFTFFSSSLSVLLGKTTKAT